MKADLTRDTFDSKKHFSQVLVQQGRVQLDAEINEQNALGLRRDETTATDIVGDCGGPADSAAFGMSAIAGQPGNFIISAGRYYVEGIQCEVEQPVEYLKQPDLLGLTALSAGNHLIYLDVWKRHLTFLDDPSLLETALGGVDTTTRVKTIWQVHTLPVTGALDCMGNYTNFTDKTKVSTILMQAETKAVANANDPCQIAEGSGYKSLENQLYRVEIHSVSSVGKAEIWKWSRENASIEVSLKAIDPALKLLTVSSLGRDKDKLGIRKGDFVEIINDIIELSGGNGDLIEVEDVDQGDFTITLKGIPTVIDLTKHPRVRRWEGTAAVRVNTWLPLEAGVEVKFSAIDVARPGDFWQIPARTSAPGSQAGTIEWPRTVPGTADALLPRGVLHHTCRLGFITVSAVAPIFIDCRCLWPSLSVVPCLFYLSGDGQEVMPRAALNKLPQPLIAGTANSQCAKGARNVRFTVLTGTGQVSAVGIAPAATTVTILINSAGEVRCDFHLDRINYSQQVCAELLDANGQAIRPALTYNATLSVAHEVAYNPGNCRGLAGKNTVQDAISTLASTARVCAIGGDGQDGLLNDVLTLPLRVAVLSACGPVEKATLIFKTDKLAQGSFSDKETGPFSPEINILTNAAGIATVFWKLPKSSHSKTFEAIAEVKDFVGHLPEGPREVFFTANLRSINRADEDPRAVHIIAVNFFEKGKLPISNPSIGSPLITNGFVRINEIAKPILISLDGPLEATSISSTSNHDKILPNPVCFLTAEIPWPFLRSDFIDTEDLHLDNSIIGFRPMLLRADTKFEAEVRDDIISLPHRISIEIFADTLKFLRAILGTMKNRKLAEKILIRLIIKGNFIWRETSADQLEAKDGGPAGWLDGDSWRVNQSQSPSAMQSLIDQGLVSGDRRRGGDFEMFFWLVGGDMIP